MSLEITELRRMANMSILQPGRRASRENAPDRMVDEDSRASRSSAAGVPCQHRHLTLGHTPFALRRVGSRGRAAPVMGGGCLCTFGGVGGRGSDSQGEAIRAGGGDCVSTLSPPSIASGLPFDCQSSAIRCHLRRVYIHPCSRHVVLTSSSPHRPRKPSPAATA